MLYSTNKVPSQLKNLDLDALMIFAAEYLSLADIDIEIVFSTLKKDQCGYVEYDDDFFEVYLNKNLSKDEFIRTLFHELVHVKQIFTQEYDPDTSKWHGEVYKCTYDQLPWEKEAYLLEEKMFNGYA
jgi:hypothetical protein